MRKFISPVLTKWIKVATLLLVFVVFLHSSKEGKNLGAESKTSYDAGDTVRVSCIEAKQVDEPVETETELSYSYILPTIVIGGAKLRL